MYFCNFLLEQKINRKISIINVQSRVHFRLRWSYPKWATTGLFFSHLRHITLIRFFIKVNALLATTNGTSFKKAYVTQLPSKNGVFIYILNSIYIHGCKIPDLILHVVQKKKKHSQICMKIFHFPTKMGKLNSNEGCVHLWERCFILAKTDPSLSKAVWWLQRIPL